MKIPAWMITKEMKHTEHYRMYAEVFGISVPLTQSRLTESTQGTYRTPSTPRSTRLTPSAPVATVDKADEMILNDTLQISLVEHKSRQEQEARENVALVDEHLASVEIEKMELQGRYGYLFEHLRARFMPRKSFATLADHLHEAMVKSLPTMLDKHEQGLTTLGNQVQVDDYDFWTESYALDDDEIPTKQVSQDIMEEISLTVDKAKLKKIADEMLRQRCTSGDEH
nr:hypothetical protein [Tanacetum cinerariifolium]